MTDNDTPSTPPQAPADDDWLKAAANRWSAALSEAGAGFRARLDAAARTQAAMPAPTPITDFDRHFQEHVSPHLLRLIVGLAPMVQLEVYEFGAAWNMVWQEAAKRGATHLSADAQNDLHAWIDLELLMRLDDPLPEGLVTPARLAEITGEPRNGEGWAWP